ncbi:hypothetical protein JF66_08900 [Cryobacterium sp. MLB-32]|uniref:hypothetical protein n=1 Tax=Cryobacterium sp. MLB-32 TaxID=1529318 RepID=UPI0004E722F3|nr:hypothetical protein [Cryobacterium sp. MLB-32]KFF59783.1 hypothetical protein JF66_08900 [Cryobacterium sp. MLB-32]
MRRSILLAIGVAVVLAGSVALGSTYLVAQRLDRERTDVASLQLADAVVGELKSGLTRTYESLPRVDLATSLHPFVIVFDEQDRAIAGTGFLHGTLGSVPHGTLDTARMVGTHHVSWQPEPGLRFATVQVAVGNVVVLAGQSLKPAEEHTAELGLQLAAAWLSLVITVAAGLILVRILAPERQAATESVINR